MKLSDLDRLMRDRETFHKLTVPAGKYIVIRVDGRSFSTLTDKHFQKPFDHNFRQHMLTVAKAWLADFGGLYAYTESDEISLLLPQATEHFDREVEKLVSVSSALAASNFTYVSNHIVAFDARIWVGDSRQDVIDYFRWRQADAARCAVNSWTYWMLLRDTQKSPTAITKMLNRKNTAWKKDLLKKHRLDYDLEVPAWQKRGLGVVYKPYIKEGYNPVTQQVVDTPRRRIEVDFELPTGKDYDEYLSDIIAKEPVSA